MLSTFIFQTFWKHIHILCYHIDISNHRRLYWIWCIWRKIAQMHVYQQLFMKIRARYRDHIPVNTDGSRDGNSVACDTVFPSDTVISMRLPESASIFTAEVWAVIKAPEQIKDSVVSKYIIFTDSLSSLQALQYMKLEIPWSGWWYESIFLILPIKTLHFAGYPAKLALGAMERQAAAKSDLDLPLVKVGVPNNDFKHHINKYILSTWQDMVGSRTSFVRQAGPRRLAILLQAVQERWSSLVSCPHRSYTSDPFIHLEEISSTSVWSLSV